MPPRPTAPTCAGTPSRTSAEARFWGVVAVAGVLAGLTGIAVTELLHLVQHTTYGYSGASFFDDVRHADGLRRVLALTGSGVVAGVGWLVLRRRRCATVDDLVADPTRRPDVTATTVDGVLQIVVVAMGASLGREGAPRQIAAALGGRLAAQFALTPSERRLVLAAGAGAGLAAVYNVPLAGCLYAVEVVLRRAGVRSLLAALVCSVIATVVSWIVLPDAAVYRMGHVHLSPSVVVFALVAGPLVGLAAWGFRWATHRARAAQPTGWRLPVTTTAVFALLGVASLAYPELLGNGRSASDLVLTAQLSVGVTAVLMVLKPVATWACLRAGATGGLLTPSLACGALAGAVAGAAWQHLWPASGAGVFALVGAVAFVTVVQRAPLCSLALVMELTGTGAGLLLPLALAAAGGHATSLAIARSAQRREPSPDLP